MNNKPQILYTVYLNKDDSIIAFEQTAEKCAELMGLPKKQNFYQIISKNPRKYTIIKKQIK